MYLLAKCIYCTRSPFRKAHIDPSPIPADHLAAAPRSAFLPSRPVHPVPSPSDVLPVIVPILGTFPSYGYSVDEFITAKPFLASLLQVKVSVPCLLNLPVLFQSTYHVFYLLNTWRSRWPLRQMTRSRFRNGGGNVSWPSHCLCHNFREGTRTVELTSFWFSVSAQ